MKSHWKAVLGVILIYIFGCFTGGVSTSIFFHHKMLDFLKHPAVAMLAVQEKRLTGNLGLDDNQKRQVHEYFLENLQQRREVQKQIQPQIQMVNRQTMQQITAILRPDQAQLFHQNVEKFVKRLKASPSYQETKNPPPFDAQFAAPATNSGAGSPP